MDETYIGGKPGKGTKGENEDGSHKRGRGTKKAPVVGAIERDGKVTAQHVQKDKMKAKNMRAFVREHVDTDSAKLITDECKGYMFGQFHSVSGKHLQRLRGRILLPLQHEGRRPLRRFRQHDLARPGNLRAGREEAGRLKDAGRDERRVLTGRGKTHGLENRQAAR